MLIARWIGGSTGSAVPDRLRGGYLRRSPASFGNSGPRDANWWHSRPGGSPGLLCPTRRRCVAASLRSRPSRGQVALRLPCPHSDLFGGARRPSATPVSESLASPTCPPGRLELLCVLMVACPSRRRVYTHKFVEGQRVQTMKMLRSQFLSSAPVQVGIRAVTTALACTTGHVLHCESAWSSRHRCGDQEVDIHIKYWSW